MSDANFLLALDRGFTTHRYEQHLATCAECLNQGGVCEVADRLWLDMHRMDVHNPRDPEAEPSCPDGCVRPITP